MSNILRKFKEYDIFIKENKNVLENEKKLEQALEDLKARVEALEAAKNTEVNTEE